MPITQSGIRLIFLRSGKKGWGVGCTIKGAVTTGQQCSCSYRLCPSCGKPFHPISSQNFEQTTSCSRIGAFNKEKFSFSDKLSGGMKPQMKDRHGRYYLKVLWGLLIPHKINFMLAASPSDKIATTQDRTALWSSQPPSGWYQPCQSSAELHTSEERINMKSQGRQFQMLRMLLPLCRPRRWLHDSLKVGWWLVQSYISWWLVHLTNGWWLVRPSNGRWLLHLTNGWWSLQLPNGWWLVHLTNGWWFLRLTNGW